MSYQYKDLRKLSKTKLIEEHDKQAKLTVVGIQYYLDEIRRRDNDRANKTVLAISITTSLVAIISLAVSIIAIYIKKV